MLNSTHLVAKTLGMISKEEKIVDSYLVAGWMAEAAIICARISDCYNLILWANEKEVFPEGYAHKVQEKKELLDLSEWFRNDSKQWIQRIKELEG